MLTKKLPMYFALGVYRIGKMPQYCTLGRTSSQEAFFGEQFGLVVGGFVVVTAYHQRTKTTTNNEGNTMNICSVENTPNKVAQYASDATCSIEGCNSKPKRRGWCSKHYLRWYAHGDPELVLRRENGMSLSQAYAFYLETSTTDENGCKTVSVATRSGYSLVGYGGKMIGLHRLALHIEHGFDMTTPRSTHVHHWCGNSACFNHEHLEAIPGWYNQSMAHWSTEQLAEERFTRTHFNSLVGTYT